VPYLANVGYFLQKTFNREKVYLDFFQLKDTETQPKAKTQSRNFRMLCGREQPVTRKHWGRRV
jgi:hypothetical protein